MMYARHDEIFGSAVEYIWLGSKKGEVRQYLAQSLFFVKFVWEGAQIWEPFFLKSLPLLI